MTDLEAAERAWEAMHPERDEPDLEPQPTCGCGEPLDSRAGGPLCIACAFELADYMRDSAEIEAA